MEPVNFKRASRSRMHIDGERQKKEKRRVRDSTKELTILPRYKLIDTGLDFRERGAKETLELQEKQTEIDFESFFFVLFPSVLDILPSHSTQRKKLELEEFSAYNANKIK